MFFSVVIFILDDIDIGAIVHHTTLEFPVPAVFNAFAAEEVLAVHGEYIQLVLQNAGCCDWTENVVQAVTVRGKGVGNGEEGVILVFRSWGCRIVVGRGHIGVGGVSTFIVCF